jgi:cytochrome b pre-mRNA-processing protein 3
MLKEFRRRRQLRPIADRLCLHVSAQARKPAFYSVYRVSDTIDGRFDLLVLHAWLMLEALQRQGERELAQSLVDMLFARLDEALREQGAGDMGMNRRMKKMAAAFYGRLQVYGEARSENALTAALLRNLYRGDAARIEHAAVLAKYVLGAGAELAQSRLTEGKADFGLIPVPTEMSGSDDDNTSRTIP